MGVRRFEFESEADGLCIRAYAWETTEPRGVVVMAHGAAEHAMRYNRFAAALNAAGYDAWAIDHRGHGATALTDGLGDFGEVGWDGLDADVGQLVEIVRANRPGDPLVLMGHSMGPMAAQQYVPDHSDRIDALVLSGSTAREVPKPGDPPPVFEPNKAFEPGRTAYDWLSRDDAEVDKYIADPWCGFETQTAQRKGGRADPPGSLMRPG